MARRVRITKSRPRPRKGYAEGLEPIYPDWLARAYAERASKKGGKE